MGSGARVGKSYGLLARPVSQGSDDGKVLNDPLGVNRLTGPRLSTWMTQTGVTNAHLATVLPFQRPNPEAGPLCFPSTQLPNSKSRRQSSPQRC